MWYLHLKCSQTIRSKQQHTTERCVPNHLKNTIYHCVCASPQVAAGARAGKIVFSCRCISCFLSVRGGAGLVGVRCVWGPGRKTNIFPARGGAGPPCGGSGGMFFVFLFSRAGGGTNKCFSEGPGGKTIFFWPGAGRGGPGRNFFCFFCGPGQKQNIRRANKKDKNMSMIFWKTSSRKG